MSVRGWVYTILGLAVLCGAGYWGSQQFLAGESAEAATAENADDKESKGKEDGKDKENGEEAVPVELGSTRRGPISAYVAGTANLRAKRDVTVNARTEGQVRRILVEEGDYVKAGQLLAQIDDRQLTITMDLTQQRLEQAKVQLERARIQRDKAEIQIANKKAELERNEAGLPEGLVSQQEVDQLLYQLRELEADEKVQATTEKENRYRVEELTAEVEQVKLDLSHTRIKAPFAGYITERSIEVGQNVRALDKAFQLGSFSPLYADVFLAEIDTNAVKEGQAVSMRLDAVAEAEPVRGRVVRISPIVDDATGTVKVTTEFRPPARSYRPGAFVRIEIETDEREDALLIPKRAIVEEEGQTYVFVADGEKAVRRAVNLGYESGAEAEVRTGLSDGDQIIVAGQGNLNDGDAIRKVEI